MNNKCFSILNVEDDLTLHNALRLALTQAGFTVFSARTKAEALVLLRQNPSLVLLDLNLPDGDGFDICKVVKETGNIPVVFLTAKDSEADIVKGLDMGGDDYITKPFRLPVLLSRIRAVLRRAGTPQSDSDTLSCGDIQLVKSRTEVTVGGTPAMLTAGEYRLLLTLLEHKHRTLTRTRLLELLWDEDGNFVNDNTLTVTVKRLREKVEHDPANPRYIKTVRGIGYKVDEENGH